MKDMIIRSVGSGDSIEGHAIYEEKTQRYEMPSIQLKDSDTNESFSADSEGYLYNLYKVLRKMQQLGCFYECEKKEKQLEDDLDGDEREVVYV